MRDDFLEMHPKRFSEIQHGVNKTI